MRILVVTNLYPRPGRETIATFNRRTFRAMANHHALEILAPVAWTEKVRDWRSGRRVQWPYHNEDGLRVHHPTYYFPPRLGTHHYGRWFHASVAPVARKVAARFKPDVLLSCWLHPDGWAANRLGRQLGVPVATKIHGSDLLVITRDPKRRAKVAEAIHEADALAPVCRLLADRAIDMGAEPDKVVVAYEGIDLDRFRPGPREEARRTLGLKPDGPLVLFVGNLLWTKGVGVLADAFGILKGRGRTIQGAIVGRGKDEPGLRERIASLGVGDLLTLHGPQPHDHLPHWYHACDLFVLPSDSEGLPNVLREAAACGRPYVATDVGGIPEVADPSFSTLIPPRSPAALADAIESMLARRFDPASIASHARNLSWEDAGHALASACELAIRRRGVQQPTGPPALA